MMGEDQNERGSRGRVMYILGQWPRHSLGR
jgi:hypothetical protein